MKNNRNVPINVLFSFPNAQTQCGTPGTWNLEKLHLELKYFGRKLCAEARLSEEDKMTGLIHRPQIIEARLTLAVQEA